MGRVGGLGIPKFTPLFALKDVRAVAKKFSEEQEKKATEVLFKIGEDFVDRARQVVSYENHTNNLRSSIGYAVYKNGVRIQSNFLISGDGTEGDGSEGLKRGALFADEISLRYVGLDKTVLIGVAGMHYAAYVERYDFDVITGSAPTRQEVQRELDEILVKSAIKGSTEE